MCIKKNLFINLKKVIFPLNSMIFTSITYLLLKYGFNSKYPILYSTIFFLLWPIYAFSNIFKIF